MRAPVPCSLNGWLGRAAPLLLCLALAVVAAILPLTRVGGQEAPAGVVITEVVANGGGGANDANFEWIEIRNSTAAPVDLSGWRLEDNHSADKLAAALLPAGGFLVVAGSASAVADLPPSALLQIIADGRLGNGLANGGDRVLLINPAGAIVDAVSWGQDQSVADVPVAPSGQSLVRQDGDGVFRVGPPSPGEASPSADVRIDPPGLRITEVFANAGAGAGDAALEWVELHNPTNAAVELEGWSLGDNTARDVLSAAALPPGGRIVLSATAAATPRAPFVLVIPDGRIGNGLANGGDVVSLFDPGGRLVDRVDYPTPPLLVPEAGRSIALAPEGWVLNTKPSPGSGAVSPMLANRVHAPAKPAVAAPVAEREQGGAGAPAEVVLSIALGVPLAALAGREAWRRRRLTA